MKRIVVLGGGISGLSLLWYLKKRYKNDAELLLLEKSARLGGWIQSHQKEGFLFERGPRSCRPQGNGNATLRLIEELHLQKEVIHADPSSKNRFIYLDQKLSKVPSHFFSALFSPLTRNVFLRLLMEWNISPGMDEDESIHAFFSRRLGQEVTETFLDSLVSGIYAGNIHELSVKSCFPQFFQWERDKGSLLKGALSEYFQKKPEKLESNFVQEIRRRGIFSFKKGMQTLSDALGERLKSHILMNHEVSQLHFEENQIQLMMANGEKILADEVYSTLPAHVLASLVQQHDKETADLLKGIVSASIATIGLGYKSSQMLKKGFGYLVPSKEKEDILGVVWDSSVFPEQNLHPEETRLTVMMGGTRMVDFSQKRESDFLHSALESIARQLDIQVEPDVVDVNISASAIPQYNVGYERKKEVIMDRLKRLSPRLKCGGTLFSGVSINDCIANAYQLTWKEV